MNENSNMNKSKILTLIFSTIPGAGYMYYGYLNIGLIYMGVFTLIGYLGGLTGMGIFTVVLLPLWAYSFFDTFQIAKGKRIDHEEENLMLKGLVEKINLKYLGYGLITLGLISIIKRVLFPMFADILVKLGMDNIYWIERYVQTILVSIVFIFGGVKLINYNKSIEEEDDEIED